MMRDHQRTVKQPPVQGGGNPSFTARREEVTNTANNQPQLKKTRPRLSLSSQRGRSLFTVEGSC